MNAFEAQPRFAATTAHIQTTHDHFSQTFSLASDADQILAILGRVARKADIIRLDAKARGNSTAAADAAEILALATAAADKIKRGGVL